MLKNRKTFFLPHLLIENFYLHISNRFPKNCLNGKTGETYYWEHFGKMDDADYSKNVFSKLQHYTSHGIVPTIQLITTYETKNNPFTINNAEKIVNDYFL